MSKSNIPKSADQSFRGLIFDLGANLKVYHLGHKLTKIGQVDPVNGYLNLDTELENLWQNLWPIINLETQIFYLIQPKTGFTSSRVVYLWLQSWQMFNGFNQVISTPSKELLTKKDNKAQTCPDSNETFQTNSSKPQSNFKEILTKQQPSHKFYLQTLNQYLALELFATDLASLNGLYQILKEIKATNNQSLIYSSPVRIGYKS